MYLDGTHSLHHHVTDDEIILFLDFFVHDFFVFDVLLDFLEDFVDNVLNFVCIQALVVEPQVQDPFVGHDLDELPESERQVLDL